MLNHCVFMGRMVRDPELRYTQEQTPVASFTLAVDRDTRDKQTDFIKFVAWKRTAEFVNQYFSKGSLAVVDGKLQSRSWTDRDGNKRIEWEVVCNSIYFGESKSQRDENDYAQAEREGKAEDSTPATNAVDVELGETDGQLPF